MVEIDLIDDDLSVVKVRSREFSYFTVLTFMHFDHGAHPFSRALFRFM
jgi:hypothetical protein